MMCLRCESQEGILAYSPMHRFRVMWIRDRHVVRQEEEGGTLGDAEERHLEPSSQRRPEDLYHAHSVTGPPSSVNSSVVPAI